MDSNSLKSAGEILKTILDERQSEQAQEFHRFFSAWDEIVGENLAGRARAKELKGNTLIVEVDHPGWIQLLEMRQGKILHELNERFPALEIRKIRFYVSGGPGSKRPEREAGREERPGEKGSLGDQKESKSPGEGKKPESSKGPEGRSTPRESPAETEEAPESKQRLNSVLHRLGGYIDGKGKDGKGKDDNAGKETED